jgi:hypothetical protein
MFPLSPFTNAERSGTRKRACLKNPNTQRGVQKLPAQSGKIEADNTRTAEPFDARLCFRFARRAQNQRGPNDNSAAVGNHAKIGGRVPLLCPSIWGSRPQILLFSLTRRPTNDVLPCRAFALKSLSSTERPAMAHNFAINDDVHHQLQGPQGRADIKQRSVYTIVTCLPIEADGRPRYRIKSKTENIERVVTEEQISRLG